MKPYYDEDGVVIYAADVRAALPQLAAESVDCCVTSPPYWGLRDYGTASWQGGDAECDHRRGVGFTADASSTLNCSKNANQNHAQEPYINLCGKCGARRVDAQIGLESTPEEYVAAMVEVFREVRRVLKEDGTLFLNLGDSFARDERKGQHKPGDAGKQNYIIEHGGGRAASTAKLGNGLKPKDLCGIPWRVAFALQADGWYLRSDIIWGKPNPMPESVRDRPTRSHEYIFLLTKSARYWYDAAAIAERASCGVQPRTKGNGESTVAIKTRGSRTKCGTPAETRNARDVWTIATEPFPDAHFAVFPTELARRCILAGCKPGGVVMDPFSGAGTVALVAKENHISFVGCEMNAAYIEIAARRLVHRVLNFEETL